jgi:hypothetical protein
MKLHISIALAISMCFGTWSLAQVGAPKLGVLRYGNGTVRPVYGIEANLIVGKQMFRAADAVSFSDAGGLLVLNGRIHLIGRNGSILSDYDAGDHKALLNIDGDLNTAIAYLPSREALLRWNGKSFILIPLDTGSFGGTVTSVQAEGAHAAKLLITDGNRDVLEITVSLNTGQPTVVRPLPGVQGPAFLDREFVIFHDERGLEVETASGHHRTIPLAAGDLKFERMSTEWLHVSSRNTKREWVLHLNSTVSELSELPVMPAHGGAK